MARRLHHDTVYAKPAVHLGRADLVLWCLRSRHPGGVNTTMCDGSVRFVKNSINLSTWSAISTTQGGEIVSSDSY